MCKFSFQATDSCPLCSIMSANYTTFVVWLQKKMYRISASLVLALTRLSSRCSCWRVRSSLPSHGAEAASSSCPIHSFQTLTYRGHKNRTPRIQYLVLIQQNFVWHAVFLRFLQIQLCTACWRKSFSPYKKIQNIQHISNQFIRKRLGGICISSSINMRVCHSVMIKSWCCK